MSIILDSGDSLEVITTSTATTEVHASWVDNASGTITPGRTNTPISTATASSA